MWHWIGICMTVLSKLSNLANDVASAGWLQDTHTHTHVFQEWLLNVRIALLQKVWRPRRVIYESVLIFMCHDTMLSTAL